MSVNWLGYGFVGNLGSAIEHDMRRLLSAPQQLPWRLLGLTKKKSKDV